MGCEVLTVAQIYAADRHAGAHGTPSLTLMENAGRTVTEEIIGRWSPRQTVVLCGPGNNGGDGLVVARMLRTQGWPVCVGLMGQAAAYKGDAAVNVMRWDGETVPLSPEALNGAELVVDALFGVGLARPLAGVALQTVQALNGGQTPVLAIDVPSGLAGDAGQPLDTVSVHADVTVTFFRKKLAHVLMPARLLCGEVVVTQIGIPETAIATPVLFENTAELWRDRFPRPDPMGHKYARGHAVVVSGPAHATGAARLAARAALRAGAGLVSVASPSESVAVNAGHLTAVMVKPFDGPEGLARLLAGKRFNAVVIGPGCGTEDGTAALVSAVLASTAATVLDADALTAFCDDPAALFAQIRPNVVLTPHGGEFERLFPGLMAESPSRIEAARAAARIGGAVVLLKGPDTAIAEPSGRVAICTNAPPTLATAGAGDVLAGLIGGLMAQGMNAFDAACAGAWLHGEAASDFGPGLIAEDLPDMLPAVLTRLVGARTQ
jgi:ADP-dependent NAD(P)H-hydrate dehydratase / NAD(P)H-hydrate epimerase